MGKGYEKLVGAIVVAVFLGFIAPVFATVVPRELALDAAQIFLSEGSAWYPEWTDAVLVEPLVMVDLLGVESAYLYPVLGTEGLAGYITISARYEYGPLIEYSPSTAFFENLQTIIDASDKVPQFIFLGPFNYFIFTDSGINSGLYRFATLQEVSYDSIVHYAQIFDSPTARTLDAASDGWERLELGTFGGEKRAAKRINSLPCFWYRGCGPTTVTMMLLSYGNNGYPNLFETRQRFSWCQYGRTTAKNLHDEVAGRCGMPIDDCEYGYGVTVGQMQSSFTQTASAHGYNFSASVDFSPNANDVKNQIDADDPVGYAIYQDNGPSGYDGHAVCGYGYDFGSTQNGILFDTWDLAEHIYAISNFAQWNLLTVEPNSSPQTPTATPIPTQPPATSTPAPTATPTLPPETATPTPTAGPGAVTVDIALNNSSFSTNDPFLLTLTLTNTGGARTVQMVVLLDLSALGVPEPYYFYPAWTEDLETQRITISAFNQMKLTLMSFHWPPGTGFATGLRFWSALFDTEMNLISDLDNVTFGYDS